VADTTVLIGGNPVKLVDNGDGTFSLAAKLVTESTPDAAVPAKASFVAGKYVTADPAYTSGDLAPIRTNAKGEIIAQISGSLPRYNGSTYDPWYNNTKGILLASAARTSTTGFPLQTNYNARGVTIFVNIMSTPGGVETLSINVKTQSPAGVAPATFAVFDLPANTTGGFALTIYPGSSATPSNPTSNKSVSLALPREWVGYIAHSSTGSWTYSVEYCYIV